MPAGIDIVVPVLNEASSIDEFHARVEGLGLADSLIFVDNGSTDGTLERLAAYPHARVIRHTANLGYGASVRDGIAAGSGERIVIIDADLEYPPEAIPELLTALERSPVVYGSRFLGPGPQDMPRTRYVGNVLLSGVYNLLFGQRTTDVYTGIKGLRRDAIDIGVLRMTGFEHGAEIALLIALSGLRIDEIPVRFARRRGGRSKMRHAPELLKLLFYLVSYWWRGRILGRPCFPRPVAAEQRRGDRIR
jgi:glycosyltransferase involved in cell wall biosynthesis